MSLTPWHKRNAPAPITSLQTEMNRMFEDFFSAPFGVSTLRRQMQEVVPALDVKEDGEAITVTAELPGVASEDVEISVHDDVLEISGKKSAETTRDEENVHIVERSYGSFKRRLVLPAEVDSERAEAAMDNGVLTLKLPKIGPKPGKRTISIK